MASRGKRYTLAAADFSFNLEAEVCRLHQELLGKRWQPGEYRSFTIYEPKERRISAAPFADRVVHHAVYRLLEPIFENDFIPDSYACRKGKGTHRAINLAQRFIMKNKFCFHGDIEKYFPSVNHGILKNILRQKIEDNDLLWLLDTIIDSAKQIPGSNQQGMPIGNLTSQLFANIYLNELDQYVRNEMGAPNYIRYMDDFLIFSDSRSCLSQLKDNLAVFLKQKLFLALHRGKSQVYACGAGIKFLGFKIFPLSRRLAKENVRRFKKRLSGLCAALLAKRVALREVVDSVRSWKAHSLYANTQNLRQSIANAILSKEIIFAPIREVIR